MFACLFMPASFSHIPNIAKTMYTSINLRSSQATSVLLVASWVQILAGTGPKHEVKWCLKLILDQNIQNYFGSSECGGPSAMAFHLFYLDNM